MKHVVVGTLVGALALSVSLAAQTQKPGASAVALGSVTLKTAVMAAGQRLGARPQSSRRRLLQPPAGET